jgi:hypothetical protein
MADARPGGARVLTAERSNFFRYCQLRIPRAYSRRLLPTPRRRVFVILHPADRIFPERSRSSNLLLPPTGPTTRSKLTVVGLNVNVPPTTCRIADAPTQRQHNATQTTLPFATPRCSCWRHVFNGLWTHEHWVMSFSPCIDQLSVSRWREAQPAMSCAHASLPLPLAMSQTSIPCVRTEVGTTLASMSVPERPRSSSIFPCGYGMKPSSGGESMHSAPKRMQQTSASPVRAGYKLSARTSLKTAFQTPFLPNQILPVVRSDPRPMTSPAAHCSSH